MMLVILVGYLYQVRLRTTVLLVGISVMLATFVLGIHWVPDMIAGVIVGWMSVMLASRYIRPAARACPGGFSRQSGTAARQAFAGAGSAWRASASAIEPRGGVSRLCGGGTRGSRRP